MPQDLTPSYYAVHGEFTEVNEHRTLFGTLPMDVAGLCRTIQGLLIHDYFGLHLYGDSPPSFHLASRETVPVCRRISDILAGHGEPNLDARLPFARTVGTCRDFSLMLCAMLRQHAIPARVRCGFARYFDPPSYEDHWICEYWKAGDQRWAMADAQLDDPHRAHLSIEFDTTDLPADQFVPSWRAWRRCRADSDHAALFGHGDHSGEWFVRVNLARDWLSLCKREVSAWDTWRDAGEQHRQSDGGAAAQCDRLAALCEAAIGLAPPGLADARLDTYLSAPPWLIGP